MLKKHLFLVIAAVAITLMIVLGAVKVMTGTRSGGPAGPGGAGGFAGGPGGPGGGGFGGGARRGTQVTPAVIGVRTFSDRIEVLGQAKAQQSITLTAPASQLVTKINFQSGQFVRRGQVLAELNATEQQAAILQARSQVALAKSNWDRWQQLADRGIAPAATAEQYKAQYEQAVATLQANQARAGDRVIRAPFSGVVGLTDAAPGMLLAPGGAIATLDDLSVIRVDFPVPEQFISLLHDGLPIKATGDAYPGVTFSGRIARLDTRLDPTTRAMTARAEFPNPDGRLRPGMLMRVNVDQASRTNPAAPEAAVVFEGGESYVLLITPAPAGAGQGQGGAGRPGGGEGGPAQRGGNAQRGGPGGQGGQGFGGAGGQGGPRLIAARRTVQTGVRSDGWVEILAGLQPGDRIVADGTNRIRPNDPISVGGGGRPGQGGAAGGQGGFGGARPGGPQGQGAPAAPGGALRPTSAPAGPAPTGGPAGGPSGGFNPQAMFQRADADGDGALTMVEWTGAGRPQQAFTRLDANGDGKITAPEMQQARARSAGGGAG